MRIENNVFSYYVYDGERELKTALEVSFVSKTVLAQTQSDGKQTADFGQVLDAEIVERKKTTVKDYIFPFVVVVIGLFLSFALLSSEEGVLIGALIAALASVTLLLWLLAVPRYTESEIIGIGILISKQAGTPYYIVPMRAADAKHAVHIIREIAKINK